MKVTQYVLPVVIGAMAGIILMTLGEMLIQTQFPLPAGTDMYDVDSLAKATRMMPDKEFVMFLINYIICSFFAGLIATLVAGKNSLRPAFVVGVVLTLA